QLVLRWISRLLLVLAAQNVDLERPARLSELGQRQPRYVSGGIRYFDRQIHRCRVFLGFGRGAPRLRTRGIAARAVTPRGGWGRQPRRRLRVGRGKREIDRRLAPETQRA